MSYTYANNVRAALGAAVGTGDVTLTVAAAVAPFNPPAAASVSVPARLTIVDNLYAPTKIEIVTYTGRTGSGPYTLTGVTRAQESTTAQAFTTGYVYQSATAADFSAFSALTDQVTIGTLGTGSDTSFDSTDSLTISHSTLSSASKWKRNTVVYEQTAGGADTNSALDFDVADISRYAYTAESRSGSITPSATTNTYQDYTLDTGTASLAQMGRVTTANYVIAAQLFKATGIATGFSVKFAANTGAPAGDLNWRLCRAHRSGAIQWEHLPILASGTLTPVASSTVTVNFSSSVTLDDEFYILMFSCVSAQGADGTYYNLAGSAVTSPNNYGNTFAQASTFNTFNADAYTFPSSDRAAAISILSGRVNAAVSITISGAYFYPSDIGKTIFGNGGQFVITNLPDICTGGTALSGAGTPANAFDTDWVGTSCAAGNGGYVGYDFGSSKTIRGIAVMFDDSITAIRNMVVEVSDDNFVGSTTVATLGAVAHRYKGKILIDISSPTAGRYIRIRETSTNPMTVTKMECFEGTSVQAHLNFTPFADTSAIASGSWTLAKAAWEGGAMIAGGSGAAVTSYTMDTSNIAAITSLSAVTGSLGLQEVSKTNFSSSSLLSLTTDYQRTIAQLTANTFVFAFASSATDGYLCVAQIDSSGSVTFGTPTPFIIAGTVSPAYIDLIALSSTTFVLSHAGTLWAGTVSGTTITLGSSVSNTANTNATYGANLVKLDSTRFAVTGLLVTTLYTAVVAGSVSGTTITLGSKVDVTASQTYVSNGACLVDTDKFIVVYAFNASSTTLRSKCITVSGTACTANAEATVSVTSAWNYSGSRMTTQLGTNKCVFINGSTGASTLAEMVVASVSGTTVTLGTPTNFGKNWSYSVATGGFPQFIGVSDSFFYAITRGLCLGVSVSGTTATVQGNGGTVPNGAHTGMHFAKGSSYAMCIHTAQVDSTPSYRLVARVYRMTAQTNLLVGPAIAFALSTGTYSVWNGSAARTIASNLNSVHGGTNGTWYYRDSASVWAAASTSTAVQALTQAFAYSANCMSLDEAKLMTAGNWTTFGFTEGTVSMEIAIGYHDTDTARWGAQMWLSQITFGVTARDRWDQLTHNYIINNGSETGVTITKATTGAKYIRAVVMGPSS